MSRATRHRWLRAACLAAAIFVAGGIDRLGALDWPTRPPVIGRSFGGTGGGIGGGYLTVGIESLGNEVSVRAIAAGELAFRRGAGYSSVPSPLAGLVVVDHGSGIRSVYGRLEPESVATPTTVEEGEILGRIGPSAGGAGGAYLAIIDQQIPAYVNPVTLLPPLPDRTAPRIVALRLVPIGGGDQISIAFAGEPARAPAGTYHVAIESYDLRDETRFRAPIAPYRWQLFIDGRESVSDSFESIDLSEADARLVRSGAVIAYLDEFVLRVATIDLQPGDAHINVVVADYTGNETSEDIFVTVD